MYKKYASKIFSVLEFLVKFTMWFFIFSVFVSVVNLLFPTSWLSVHFSPIHTQTGAYEPGWFTLYMLTFNMTYLIYILFHTFFEYLTFAYYYILICFDFDYHTKYLMSEHRFIKKWNSKGYALTSFLYIDFNNKVWRYYTSTLNAIGIINGVDFSPSLFMKQLNRISFVDYNNELNTLMVLGATLFVLSSLISLFMLSYLGMYGVFIFNLITIVFFWFTTILRLNFFFLSGGSFKMIFGKWFSLWGYLIIPFEIYIDSISYSYILLTLTIALCVYFYVFSYFRYEPNVERLLIFINLFVISMILLVSSGNFFVLFLGWELIGLTSFFLINFWSTRIGTLKAAFKAYVFNKFSDVSLFIGIVASILLIGDTNICAFNSQIHLYQNYVLHINNLEVSYIEFISFFFLSSAFIKSAQFGTHIWLPDSMEAPAPASALIHSATLVSAGVFLILRLMPLFELSLYSFHLLALIGSFTAFFGGCCAMYQSDIKRILAYSTISHCGFLMVTCTTRVPEITIFYLYVHGFFKAAVFLCIGNIIRFSQNYQDFKKMGSYWKYLPFECICSLICLVNLSGLPFTLGFYIKHLFLVCLNKDVWFYYIIIGFIIGAALSGLIYSFRLYYYVFFDFKKGKKYIYVHSNRANLKSIFYSNTTLASNFSITTLILLGYVICIYLYFIFFSKFSIAESIDIVSIIPSNIYNINWPLKSFLNFLGGLNWFILQIIFILIISVWRFTYNFHSLINTIFFLIIVLVLSYLNSLLLVV